MGHSSVALYCDLCIVEVEARRRPGTHFTKLGQDNLIVSFNKATGREYSKLQLKNKWDALKNDWKLWKQLIGKETGLGWNAQLKTIDAPEDWWLSKQEVCILVVLVFSLVQYILIYVNTISSYVGTSGCS